MAQSDPILTVTSDPEYTASYSSLRLWLSCQERWRQVKGLKRKRRSGWATVGGTAVHDLTSRWEMEYSHPDQGVA